MKLTAHSEGYLVPIFVGETELFLGGLSSFYAFRNGTGPLFVPGEVGQPNKSFGPGSYIPHSQPALNSNLDVL